MSRPASPDYGTRVLEPGIGKGRDVWELQIKLIGWGSGSDGDGIGQVMDPVRVNGEYDGTTRDAVKRFQKAHGLPITGVVDVGTYRAIDREAGEHPIFVADLACPCARGTNDGPILCRCDKHPDEGKCSGFGKKRFAGKFLLDGTAHAGETLDVYDMEEHDGIDKAVLWAARALMHRAAVQQIVVKAGYRCWHDNYHVTDDSRWKHRRSTLHLGKSIQFIHAGTCVEAGGSPCPECARIRGVALAKCGFQLRWHEPDRVSIAEGRLGAPAPAAPFAVHVDTARRRGREKDDFVKTDEDAVKPLYSHRAGLSYPVDLGGGLDPKVAPSAPHFQRIEVGKGGVYPIGKARTWHGGVHVPGAAGDKIRAMFDGEIVGCRAGEAEDAEPHGSRNFVLIKHTWKDKVFYSLTMHLDAEVPSSAAEVAWRRALHVRTKDHVEALAPSPVYLHNAAPPGALTPKGNLAPGERAETTGVELDPKTLDPTAPAGSKVIQLASPPDAYVYTSRGGVAVAKVHAADAALASALSSHDVIGLESPIRVFGGDVLGKIAKAPTDASLAGIGASFRLETFSEANLLTDAGYALLDASDAAKAADRKDLVEKLVAAKLVKPPVDGVLLDADLDAIKGDPDRGRFRSVVLKMPHAFALDWKDALAKSSSFGFMKDVDRDALGDAYNKYRFWSEVQSGKGSLPGAETVFHVHPITLLLQIAFAPP
ncbi:uncharacterized protein SOCE26_049230 [Sorangium cellulosum]|uniref:Peptidoglycan binding-like domain-containing protein n=1 Tax=Sorangium cellulosum TaxID=56 RepID=A0A2L0EW03_SORCE|nr:peptidoglycan-binding protein [Sorangium cellulosum]AUX43474.1 uncharacterized protein SOCE26_049230 [Sorangium cellulosum]